MHHPGRTLRRLRLLQRMKQSHLADQLDVSQATVSRWERGLLPMSGDQQAAARPRGGDDAAGPGKLVRAGERAALAAGQRAARHRADEGGGGDPSRPGSRAKREREHGQAASEQATVPHRRPHHPCRRIATGNHAK